MFAMRDGAPPEAREREAVAGTGPVPAGGEIAFNFDKAYTLREVAERLGISLRQVEMHVADESLRVVNVGRGAQRRDLRVLDEDLEAFVQARGSAAPIAATPGPGRGKKPLAGAGTGPAAGTPNPGDFIRARVGRVARGRA